MGIHPIIVRRQTMKWTMSTITNKTRPHGGAVFLDRDGTIIEDRGDLSAPSEVVWFEDTISSLRRLSDCFDLFIVTNQSGVAKGTISMEAVDRVNAYVSSHLAQHGISIVATYVCPHERASDCHCIKPKPHFLKRAERDFRIDLRRSFVVGDHPHDVELAKNVGATGIYVLSGHGRKHRRDIPGDAIVADGIGEASEHILERACHAEGRRQHGEPRSPGGAGSRAPDS
jgi:D-glycero-D-manno-heptose 1,7-bisphosphate phosphatase